MLAPPVGGARERGTPWPLAYLIAGGTAGGLLLGTFLAIFSIILGLAPATQIGMTLGIALVAGVAALVHPAPWWLPQRSCQVTSRRLTTQHITQASFGWGFDLGLGVRTFVVTPAFYGIVGLGVAAPHPLMALVVGAIYGFTRTVTIAGFSRVVRRQLATGWEGVEPGLGLANRLRIALAAFTVLAAVLALQW